MAFETRTNGRYYYRKHRFGDRVISQYIGTGSMAECVEAIDIQHRQQQTAIREKIRNEEAAVIEEDQRIEATIARVNQYVRGILILNGYHRHKGGEWRRSRQ